MTLKKYREKRLFEKTPEPKGLKSKKSIGFPTFCVQKHAATHLHYDFRLEHKGVLLSWAVPKGPSLNPLDKRLAVHVEDHPLEYRHFQGTIPKGNYGAGTVEIWDEGALTTPGATSKKDVEKAIDAGLKKGHLTFSLMGKKLQGTFNLVKLKDTDKNWLLIKGKDALPKFFSPMLATLKEAPFDDPDWLFEIKWDGYRALAFIDQGKVNLYSRNENLFNPLFSKVVNELEKIPAQVILDGELVILDEKGRSDFQLMQNYQRIQKGNLFFIVFDLLYWNGEDLRDRPLIERKEKLQILLTTYPSELICFGDHVEKKGIAFFSEAQKYKVEGVIAKRKESLYVSRRSKEWLKIKTANRQEALIGGFTEARGSRKHFGALLLGVYNKNKKLIYTGHVGTGFTQALLKDIYEKMVPLIVKECPFDKKIKTNMPATWIKPELSCEVVFAEWTDEGIMRHPSFKGLRVDKQAKEVIREIPS
jgi:bifunctional non-homologous end joining protein LigD